MKKVLMSIGNLSGGGAERVVSVWSGILADVGYDVSIYIAYRTDGEYPINNKVHVECTAETKESYFALPSIKRLLNKRAYIKKWRPDVVVNFLPNNQIRMLFIAAGIKMRRIETVRINPWKAGINNKMQQLLWMQCFKAADAIIVQTDEQSEFFDEKNRKKCAVIHNPISEVYKKSAGVEYEGGITKFVAAGRLDSQKNFPMLIEAFSRAARSNSAITLDIYGTGNGEYTAYLQKCIDDAGVTDRITLKGRTTDMRGALMQHGCFIMSSDYEGMPNALAEAMAVGMVCISTDCKTGPCDMIQNGENGYLVKTGDVDSMAEAIKKVISMTGEQCREMGSAAREDILALCDDEVNIKKLIEVIEG